MTSNDRTLNTEEKAHAGNATQNKHPLLDGEIRFISTKNYRKKSLLMHTMNRTFVLLGKGGNLFHLVNIR